MDYYLLTDMAAQIGYELAAAGAETFRIEETMRRVLAAYGIECEAFAIPNCVMVSLEADNGKPLMVMKRVGFHGNDLDAVERLNALSRRICAETPDPAVAAQWLEETRNDRRSYSVPVYYLGNLLAASGFCPVFGGTLRDSLWAGLLGLIIGFVTRGFGVSIHKRDCGNARESMRHPENADRWVRAYWDEAEKENYKATLDIVCMDRANLVSDVALALGDMRVPIYSLTARAAEQGRARMSVTVGITNTEHLNSVVARLKKIKDVVSVTRN